jgi:uncharacterized protein (DUF1778 family)
MSLWHECGTKMYAPGVYTRTVSQAGPEQTGRIHMRVSERQERILRAAAELTGETMTGFVLAAATERAETVLERAERINLSAQAFQRFVAALDQPAEEMAVLRHYAITDSPIPSR